MFLKLRNSKVGVLDGRIKKNPMQDKEKCIPDVGLAWDIGAKAGWRCSAKSRIGVGYSLIRKGEETVQAKGGIHAGNGS